MSTATSGTARPMPGGSVGMVTRSELLDALNELLEAERAGARVAMATAREITPADLSSLVHDIQLDEGHWCRMLLGTIRGLDGKPSGATGAFWDKSMAIPDPLERLRFLNRGQAWVVRRLQALIPRVEDAPVRADLMKMLIAHERNIERVEQGVR